MRQVMRGALLLAAASLGATPGGCSGREGERPPRTDGEFAHPRVQAGGYAVEDGALYRVRSGDAQVLAVLPGATTPAADTLTECASAIPELGPARFEVLNPAPNSEWVAWTTGGPGVCVGVVGPGAPAVRVVGHWSAAVPDSLLWAPAGRYLAVWLGHPSGGRSLVVYDAAEDSRLEMPWQADCPVSEECDVASVRWLGGSLLNVEIRLGPAEPPVPYEVNVGTAGPVLMTEES